MQDICQTVNGLEVERCTSAAMVSLPKKTEKFSNWKRQVLFGYILEWLTSKQWKLSVPREARRKIASFLCQPCARHQYMCVETELEAQTASWLGTASDGQDKWERSI